jgi:hypothetical protein
LDGGSKLSVLTEGQNAALGGRNDGLDGQHGTLLVTFTHVVRVFEQAVNNTTHTECRLDDGRSDVLTGDLLLDLLDLDHGLGDLQAFNDGLATEK